MRELQEETGLDSQVLTLAGTHIDEASNNGVPAIRLFLATVAAPLPVQPQDMFELAAAAWMTVPEALAVLVPKRQAVLQQALLLFAMESPAL